MVQAVMKFLDDTPNVDVKLSVIETLRTVTEGKVCQPSQPLDISNRSRSLLKLSVPA